MKAISNSSSCCCTTCHRSGVKTFCTAAWPAVRCCSTVYHPDVLQRGSAQWKISQTILLNKTTYAKLKVWQLIFAIWHEGDRTLGWPWDTSCGEKALNIQFIGLWSLTFLMVVHLFIWSSKDCTRAYTFGAIDVVLVHFHSSYLGILVTSELTTIQSRVGENKIGSYAVVETQL